MTGHNKQHRTGKQDTGHQHKPTHQHRKPTPLYKKYGFRIMVEHFNKSGKLIEENFSFLFLQDLENKGNNYKEDKQINRIVKNKIEKILLLQQQGITK